MYIDFNQLPDDAKLWIYQGDRPFSGEADAIDKLLRTFTGEWVAHGQPLRASYRLLEDQFIALAVDEKFNDISGCSIDSSVHLIQEITKQTGIDFFNRDRVPFRMEEGIKCIPLKQLKQKYAEGIWNGRTQTFNIQAGTVGAVRNNWLIPAEKTWLSRYMKVRPADPVAG